MVIKKETDDNFVPITIQLRPQTIQRLQEVATYLSFRDSEETTVETVIKGALVDYLDVMTPIKSDEVTTLKSLLFHPKTLQPYMIKNRFKALMKKKGLKAVDLHRMTDISESNLSQVLNNKNQNMSLDYFLRIWIALDCPPVGDCLYRENL
ncbi:helix-turn-helix domain-containing protein [Cytobacillus sp. FJAT-54145]|uniref:Helix-turn-helix domain-containing protein n=1 Tax=Cytobacillus spartinae TaxID=3299023 RepID=A0ABW6K9W5_9BACI